MLNDLITEKDLQATIVEAARLRHWLVYHTYDARRSEPGFPDLVLVRHPRLIFAELKDKDGVLTKGKWNKKKTRWLPGQYEWMHELGQCVCEIYIWRPQDLDHILEQLT